jgi:hypothetical protein
MASLYFRAENSQQRCFWERFLLKVLLLLAHTLDSPHVNSIQILWLPIERLLF